jgi:hypothetical protein
VRSRLFMTTVLSGLVGAIDGTSRVTLGSDVRRGLSFRCWIFGHEDWVRRVPGRLYLECLDCGRETPGWTTSRHQSGDAVTSPRAQAITAPPDRSGSDATPSAVGPSRARSQQFEIPIAA